MREHLRNEKLSAAASAVVLAVGVIACGSKSSQPQERQALSARECNGSSGLPAVTKLPGTPDSFIFPNKNQLPCEIRTYDHDHPYDGSSPGSLFPGKAFEVLCIYYGKPEAALVQGHHPLFEGTVNLSDAASREFAEHPGAPSAQPCKN